MILKKPYLFPLPLLLISPVPIFGASQNNSTVLTSLDYSSSKQLNNNIEEEKDSEEEITEFEIDIAAFSNFFKDMEGILETNAKYYEIILKLKNENKDLETKNNECLKNLILLTQKLQINEDKLKQANHANKILGAKFNALFDANKRLTIEFRRAAEESKNRKLLKGIEENGGGFLEEDYKDFHE